MTNSGFPQFPANPHPAGQAIPPKETKARDEPRYVRLIKIPDDLKEVRTATKLRGVVVRQNRDGSVTIKTPRGEVDVKPPQDQPPPQRGENVEIEIKPGRPPAEATIQRTQAPPAHSKSETSSPETQPSTSPRVTNTPVNIDVGQARHVRAETITLQTPPTTTMPQTLPEPGAMVQLQPIAAKEALALISQKIQTQSLIQTTATQIIQSTVISAQSIASNITPEIANSALRLSSQTPPAPLPNISVIMQSTPSALAVPILQTAITIDHSAQESLPTQINLTTAKAKNPVLDFFKFTDFSSAKNTAQNLSLASTLPDSGFLKTNLPRILSEASLLAYIPNSESLPVKPLQSALPFTVRINSIDGAKITLTPLLQAGEKNDLPSMAELKNLKTTSEEKPLIDQKRPESLQAIITGSTLKNLPILRIFLPQSNSIQYFSLQSPASEIIPGTQIQITPLPASENIAVQPSNIPSSLSAFLTPGAWPVFQDIYQTLAATNPTLAQMLSNITPNANAPAQFTPAALFFIAAMRSGDIGSWLGDKISDTLRRNERSGLLSRLTQDSSILSRLSAEPISQEWRALSLPLFWQGEMQKMALFYRNEDNKDEADQAKQRQTRFIFNLNLSHMGAVQLDGLLREKRLDLILRTESTFSQTMRAEMRQLYTRALGQTDITGELSFQNEPEQWVNINVEENKNIGVSA